MKLSKEHEQSQNNVAYFDENSNGDTYWNENVEKGYASIIKETFLGLFRSLLTCPECMYNLLIVKLYKFYNRKTSVTYEPFNVIPLPII